MIKKTLILIAALVTLMFGSLSKPGVAQDTANRDLARKAGPEFQIESWLYIEDDPQPVTRNLTLFSERLVFDFQLDPKSGKPGGEIVVFDQPAATVVLLDPRRKVYLELHDLKVLKILNTIRADMEQDQRTSFLVNDEFEETIDAETRTVTLTSKYMEYKMQGMPPQDENLLPTYFSFLDAFTRMQVTDPTTRPPFARLQLNQSIRRVGWIPERVELTVKANPFSQASNAHTEHKLTTELAATHRQWIQEAKQKWSGYRAVGLAEYRGLNETSSIESRNPVK